ncbi:MAG: hypothetical protein VXA43_04245 [Candidatus Poseidoniales archaeon]
MDLRLVGEVLETVAGSDEQQEPEDKDEISKGDLIFLFVAFGIILLLAVGFLLLATDYSVVEMWEEVWMTPDEWRYILMMAVVAFGILAQVWIAMWVWRKITGLAAKGAQNIVDDLKK